MYITYDSTLAYAFALAFTNDDPLTYDNAHTQPIAYSDPNPDSNIYPYTDSRSARDY